MKKTLYSLMLDDEVVRAVDLLAHRRGVSRSALVNQILAEYAELTTPERRVGDVFRAIEALMQPDTELVPFFAPNAMTMSLKSALDYKYRPTVKYEVQLYRGGAEDIGELSVVFRTQSAALLGAMGAFFRLWKRLEDRYLAPRLGRAPDCALYEGRFLRRIAMPNRDCSTDELAQTISGYVRLFDRLMKDYLSGRLDEEAVEQRYAHYTKTAPILI